MNFIATRGLSPNNMCVSMGFKSIAKNSSYRAAWVKEINALGQYCTQYPLFRAGNSKDIHRMSIECPRYTSICHGLSMIFQHRYAAPLAGYPQKLDILSFDLAMSHCQPVAMTEFKAIRTVFKTSALVFTLFLGCFARDEVLGNAPLSSLGNPRTSHGFV